AHRHQHSFPTRRSSDLETLRKRGVRVVEPGDGYLACGMSGPGRLAENEAIVAAVMEALGASQELAGETVLITAGPTREKIDPVRSEEHTSELQSLAYLV